jgi:hypothetical protein
LAWLRRIGRHPLFAGAVAIATALVLLDRWFIPWAPAVLSAWHKAFPPALAVGDISSRDGDFVEIVNHAPSLADIVGHSVCRIENLRCCRLGAMKLPSGHSVRVYLYNLRGTAERDVLMTQYRAKHAPHMVCDQFKIHSGDIVVLQNASGKELHRATAP